ncbi:hypothetical protein OLMES_1580 [Oleiphilus messinensis]|uniref:Uncharacterized protein n=1 Tax=Oleiphilus messinensis TaxID=141451 RepID=A0A1Y0I836_9GAMM|nr:hypothetical protein [Oleiphilus messinensis]ARU55655.1 hypothetical protein OLMES_1580 [Oleiphilus messinensis]
MGVKTVDVIDSLGMAFFENSWQARGRSFPYFFLQAQHFIDGNPQQEACMILLVDFPPFNILS